MANRGRPIEYVGFMFRLAAWLVDAFFIGLILAAAILPLLQQNPPAAAYPRIIGLSLFFPLVYTLGSWILFSRTLGKYALSCTIKDASSGGKPKIWQFVVRYLVFQLSVLTLFVGCLAAIRSKRKRAWHDYFSKTMVIADGSMRPLTAAELNAP